MTTTLAQLKKLQSELEKQLDKVTDEIIKLEEEQERQEREEMLPLKNLIKKHHDKINFTVKGIENGYKMCKIYLNKNNEICIKIKKIRY